MWIKAQTEATRTGKLIGITIQEVKMKAHLEEVLDQVQNQFKEKMTKSKAKHQSHLDEMQQNMFVVQKENESLSSRMKTLQ